MTKGGLAAACVLCAVLLGCSGSDTPQPTPAAPAATSVPVEPAQPTAPPPTAVAAVPTAEPSPTATAVPTQPAPPVAPSLAAPPPPSPTAVPVPASSPTPEAPARPPPVTVAMTLSLADRSFSPHQVHGNAGDTVVLTFRGGTEAHTFTVASLGIDVAIAARETKQFSFVMPVEGEVPFFCRLHGSASAGMHGLLIFH